MKILIIQFLLMPLALFAQRDSTKSGWIRFDSNIRPFFSNPNISCAVYHADGVCDWGRSVSLKDTVPPLIDTAFWNPRLASKGQFDFSITNLKGQLQHISGVYIACAVNHGDGTQCRWINGQWVHPSQVDSTWCPPTFHNHRKKFRYGQWMRKKDLYRRKRICMNRSCPYFRQEQTQSARKNIHKKD